MDATNKKLPPRERKNEWPKYLAWAFVAALIIWAFVGMPAFAIKPNAGQIGGSIMSGIFHPDWAYVYRGDGEDLVSTLLQTIAIAFIGTFISAIVSLPFAFWAANTKHKFWLVTRSGKFLLTAIRTFPEIVLALMFIKAVGPSAFAGVLAVGFHSVGMLAKLFSEAIENLDNGAGESVTSAGGTRMDVTMLATIPQLLPELISNTLYRFELAIRSASILGIVGAGGIGTPLIFAISARAWSRVGIILLGIVIMVTLVDFISGSIRKKLI
ncbi:phosphonate ABC transporter, permease protein PhnE [Schleiferilactobacillus perolens]|jgi:phosphonate transport system permease protein|uniref:phosphonate ABC transporter, permease protein PhnE n=1 Tax=Schleiferilactobacillus perolens TaxID=100468 RepID=UPI000E7F0577|nr:phosphonate ABC transporter, permease protein PhnE [Schleiferilactobacillus perolens]MCI1891859.1 phosphonate ABC transporter, permease protein PhnE [Schleiferilactobacillus harbinensis]MCI1911636.1 phosphonate ABC transporter, permease protein PhnE [Schleiferilactobacillus harbinensis]MCI2171830.1 phosphonate ABC transporter, permease protein PhnE [Schleiferilactobacillus perolens]HAY53331.1 phosphonate ABC transporter, permease protein PhnE [Lactobacillus sp.]